MSYTIDIDTGGTFTDGFFTREDRFETVKVDTTPHDLTVCFMECIKEGSKRFGLKEVGDLLKETDVVRFSTTIPTNALLQRAGTKLGLIVTRGFEESLYQDVGESSVYDFIISRDMVIGIGGEVSDDGKVVKEIDERQNRCCTFSFNNSWTFNHITRFQILLLIDLCWSKTTVFLPIDISRTFQ